MKIVFVVAGTEGDVRPNVALGAGLREAGHAVGFLTSREFEHLVRGEGLDFAPLGADFRETMEAEKRSLAGRPAAVVAWRGLRRLRTMAASWVHESRPAMAGAGLVIGSGAAAYFAAALAEAYGVGFVRSALFPTEPSPEIPPPMLPMPARALPGPVNLLVYASMRNMGWQIGRPIVAGFTRELGLGPPGWRGPWASAGARRDRVLNGFSPNVVPPSASWGAAVATTGFWRLDARPDPPSEPLRRFVESGPAPVYVGFGSTVPRDPARLAAIVIEAIERCGMRAVIVGGWGGMAAHVGTRGDLLTVERAPFDWLFPRVRVAVHHAGAGTIDAALCAGLPSVSVPFLFDQFFWARRLQALGVAPPPLRHARMTSADLADAIVRADEPPMREAAARLGGLVRAETGVGDAIDALRWWGLLEEPAA